MTPNDDDIECNDQGEDDSSREGETADEKVSLVSVPEVLYHSEGQAEGPGDATEAEVGVGWSEMEKGLYEKGLQIFGRNRYCRSDCMFLCSCAINDESL